MSLISSLFDTIPLELETCLSPTAVVTVDGTWTIFQCTQYRQCVMAFLGHLLQSITNEELRHYEKCLATVAKDKAQ